MDTKERLQITVLEDKKIKIEPIIRKHPFFREGHDGQFMFTGCRQRYSLPYVTSTSSYVNIFDKDKREQEQFEELLNKEPKALSLYNRKSTFWSKFWFEIGKEGTTLDLNNPVHALQFKLIKANKDYFAPSWGERFNRPSYKYAIVDSKAVVEEENKSAVRFEKAMDLFQEMKKSKTKLFNTLRLLDKKPSETMSIEQLKADISKIINQTEKLVGTPNIDDFIRAASDPQSVSKIFVLDAIDAKAINVDQGEFRQTNDNRLVGKSLQEVVDHYDDAQFQEDKILIMEKIKRANK